MTASHPYETAPRRAFWSRAVARGWSAEDVFDGGTPLIRPDDLVASAGSCFAANVVPYLEEAGFSYLRAEPPHPFFTDIEPEPFGYEKFSAAYGNIYTARQLLQLVQRSMGDFTPREDRWATPDGIVDPFRPGLRYRAKTDREFELLTAQHLRRVRRMIEDATVFVFTLGLTEAWMSERDGAVFPACPGTVAGSFDPERHVFRNFTAADVAADLRDAIAAMRALNPELRIVLTVSPVPLVATATGVHVLAATTYSKSVLRVAAGEVASTSRDVTYFPAYEIVTGPQAPETFFAADRRNVSEAGIRAVMGALLSACGRTLPAAAGEGSRAVASPDAVAALSRAVDAAECEEAMADVVVQRPAGRASPLARLKRWAAAPSMLRAR